MTENAVRSPEVARPDQGGRPLHGSAAPFTERRVDYRHERLRTHWQACPECGALWVNRPRAHDLERVPEADGVCAACGAVFTCDPDGSPRLLAAGHSPAGMPA